MNNRLRFCAGFTALAIAALLQLGAKAAAPPHFLRADSIDVAALLPAPSLGDSAETRAELDVLLRVQKARTPEEVARATSERTLTLDAFTSVTGPWLNQKDLPQVYEFAATAANEAKYFTEEGKAHFARPRPSLADPHITPAFGGDADASYPSGHSTRGMVLALLLSDALPDLRAKLIARGDEIGWDRVIAGVHYPSDVVAGRVLGQAIARELLANPDFLAQWRPIRESIQAARHSVQAAAPVGAH